MPRFTESRFDQQTVKVASANTFTAQIRSTGNAVKAHVTFKDNRAQKEVFYTFLTEGQMQDNLRKLDPSVKFLEKQITQEATAATRAEQDDTLLEAMRVDPSVKDQAYRNACRSAGQPPKPRPDFTGTSAAQKITPLQEQIEQFRAFAQVHQDLNRGLFREFNYRLIHDWCANENREVTTPNMEQAYEELTAAGCFKHFDTGRPGGRIVRPYVHAELVAARKQRGAAVAPPAGLSPVDEQCWKLVHAQNPTLDTRSPQFRTACQQQIWLWARTNALKEGFTDENEGEMRKRCEQIVLDWARQSNQNIGTGNRAAKDTRVWLG
jgi:hypothetical protein